MKSLFLPPIAPPLLAWYDRHRRTLPWRGANDPYKIWISEIMLQQTRVAAVIPYYRRWMEALPDVASLAAAEESRLMKLWEGLGYYSRARNLQRAARIIVDDLGGVFPHTYETLLALPGVGDYTAGAVASIAFGEAVPAVDGNVLRIIARLLALREDVTNPAVRKKIRALVCAVLPEDRPGAFNQALMDLGAVVCLPGGAPLCEACPLANLCAARAQGTAEDLPVRKKKPPRRVEELTVYILLRQGRVALRQREEAGLLAGLWEFPHVPGTLGEGEAGKPLEQWGLRPVDWRQRVTARHIFTHVEWRMTGYLAEVQGDGTGLAWADGEALSRLAIPSAFGKFLALAIDAIGAQNTESSE